MLKKALTAEQLGELVAHKQVIRTEGGFGSGDVKFYFDDGTVVIIGNRKLDGVTVFQLVDPSICPNYGKSSHPLKFTAGVGNLPCACNLCLDYAVRRNAYKLEKQEKDT